LRRVHRLETGGAAGADPLENLAPHCIAGPAPFGDFFTAAQTSTAKSGLGR
jgi:hypothetical protein